MIRMRTAPLSALLSAAAFGMAAVAAAPSVRADASAPAPSLKVNPDTGETEAQFAKRTAWWREAKFGMFIHWGIYAVPNSDRTNTDHELTEWYLSANKMQVADYEKFAAQFHPTKFDAKAWVATAKAAGMKYIVITSKHHDGFCMFDSKLTDYNVVKATPWHHDPMKDLAAECRKQGITLCFYHSFMDWHHPDYLPRRPWDTRPTQGADLNRYVDYMEGQLKELLTNYGPIGGIWFDGGWEHNATEERSREVDKVIRSIQPNVMINDRINIPEDYSTPERTIPARALPDGRLWETCTTSNESWGYSWKDNQWKSTERLIHELCDIAGKGGNLLLNVGPDADGQMPPEALERLRQIGAWMKENGASVYGTTKSPYLRLPYSGTCTQKGNTLYLQVFTWPAGGLTLSGLKTPVREARALAGGAKLAVETLPGGTLRIGKPATIDPYATVVALRLAGPPVLDEAALTTRIAPQADGRYVLTATDAEVQGGTAHLESSGGKDNVGYWTNAKDTVFWNLTVPPAASGRYRVEVEYACEPGSAGSTYAVTVGGGAPVTGDIASTGSWQTYTTARPDGTLTLTPGKVTLRMVPQTMPHGAVMNLRRITLVPERGAAS